jgi:phosphatidylglycerol:prolipoprotein diacylglycerol transferase
MVHDLDPVLWHIYGDIGIRWYGLSYIMGFIAAYFVISWLGERQKSGLTSDMVSDLITYLALGTIIGGRLGYVFFYSPDLLTKFKPDFPFWGVFAVNEGGMASHGGMIGITIACWLYVRKTGINFPYLLDLCAVSGPIGVTFGRIANFINGELVGRPAPPDLPWAVKFPQDIYLWPKNEPQKLEGLSSVVDKMGINASQWLDWVHQMKSDPAAREQVFSGISKIVTEIQHGNGPVKEALAPLLTARHPSQLYAALLEGALLFLILLFLWRRVLVCLGSLKRRGHPWVGARAKY